MSKIRSTLKDLISRECPSLSYLFEESSEYLKYMFNYIDHASDEQIKFDLLGGELEENIEDWEQIDKNTYYMSDFYKYILRTSKNPIRYDEKQDLFYTTVKFPYDQFPNFLVFYSTESAKSNLEGKIISGSFLGVSGNLGLIRIPISTEKGYLSLDDLSKILSGEFDEELKHELNHYLKQLSDNEALEIGSHNTNDPKVYFNHPYEFEAYGTAILSAIKDLEIEEIESISKKYERQDEDFTREVIHAAIENRKSFNAGNKVIHKEFIDNLNPNNREILYKKIVEIVNKKLG